MTRYLFAFTVGVLCLSIFEQSTFAYAPKKPNIVFILADDLGGHDIGCFGSTFHKTPHLDALARRGCRYTNAYSASPLCSPTRSSILTGLAPARTGITAPVCHLPTVQLEKRLVSGNATANVLVADSITRLKTDYVTLPKVLKQAGYRTSHFGKWHLGPKPYSALQHGFDIDLPHTPGPGPGGVNGYFAPWTFWKDQGKPGEQIDDRMGEEAAKFIAENKDRPFYLNYWSFGVHSPWMGKKEYIEEAAKRADPKAGQRNPVYAAMVRSLDDSIGRILNALDDHKLTDNTIIIFTSDNGGWHNVPRQNANNAAYANIPVTSNAPFRSGKASNYEGGTHIPQIIVAPGLTRPGSQSDAIVQSTDFFPTILELLKLEKPQKVTFDGISIVPTLTGQPLAREAIYCHFPHGGADTIDGFRPATWIRQGEWKLIRFFADNADGSDKLELFNLKDDPGEQSNLAAQQPERVRELNAKIERYLTDTEAVRPKLNPKASSKAAPGDWTPNKFAKLELKDGVYVLTSTGGDPFISVNSIPNGTGPYTLELKMKSTSKGNGQVFWSTAKERGFQRSRSVAFEPKHDGEWQSLSIKLPVTEALTALRIDPSTAVGVIEFESIVLKGSNGQPVRSWPGGKPKR